MVAISFVKDEVRKMLRSRESLVNNWGEGKMVLTRVWNKFVNWHKGPVSGLVVGCGGVSISFQQSDEQIWLGGYLIDSPNAGDYRLMNFYPGGGEAALTEAKKLMGNFFSAIRRGEEIEVSAAGRDQAAVD